jgi:antitoxin (DNA-binding transcriptional repressor) of toxin-antitoxin stability system
MLFLMKVWRLRRDDNDQFSWLRRGRCTGKKVFAKKMLALSLQKSTRSLLKCGSARTPALYRHRLAGETACRDAKPSNGPFDGIPPAFDHRRTALAQRRAASANVTARDARRAAGARRDRIPAGRHVEAAVSGDPTLRLTPHSDGPANGDDRPSANESPGKRTSRWQAYGSLMKARGSGPGLKRTAGRADPAGDR